MDEILAANTGSNFNYLALELLMDEVFKVIAESTREHRNVNRNQDKY